MGKLAKRVIHKIIREASPFIDSYSLYFNSPPSQKRVKRLSEFAKVAEGVEIIGKISAPTPGYLEIGENVAIEILRVAPEKFVMVESDVKTKDITCHQHTIITKSKIYRGKEIPEKVITISVDIEGGIALSHATKESWNYLRKFWDSGKAVEKLASLFKKYEIPVTWAICGHLFLNKCAGNHGFLEKDWFGDWFKHDPATNYKKNSSWYMPEIIQALSKESLFEIGYHSFGHFFYQKCSKDTIKKDILMAKKIQEEYDIKFESFVFPFNQCGYFDLLINEGGFYNFRGNIGRQYRAYGIFDFKDFRFFNTTEMFAPDTMDRCNSQLEHLYGTVANYYTHCYQWIEKDGWKDLEGWLLNLSKLRDLDKIIIKSFQNV